jgi:hypothetical protein
MGHTNSGLRLHSIEKVVSVLSYPVEFLTRTDQTQIDQHEDMARLGRCLMVMSIDIGGREWPLLHLTI